MMIRVVFEGPDIAMKALQKALDASETAVVIPDTCWPGYQVKVPQMVEEMLG